MNHGEYSVAVFHKMCISDLLTEPVGKTQLNNTRAKLFLERGLETEFSDARNRIKVLSPERHTSPQEPQVQEGHPAVAPEVQAVLLSEEDGI